MGFGPLSENSSNYIAKDNDQKPFRETLPEAVSFFNEKLQVVKNHDANGFPLASGWGKELNNVQALRVDAKGSVDDSSLQSTKNQLDTAIQKSQSSKDKEALVELRMALDPLQELDNALELRPIRNPYGLTATNLANSLKAESQYAAREAARLAPYDSTTPVVGY
jgi:hypothetical protein